MLDQQQEKKMRKLKKRFTKLHGERKWSSLRKYTGIFWMTPTKISRVLLLSMKTVRYWTRKIQELEKKQGTKL